LIACVLLSASLLSAGSEARKLYPADDASKDPSFQRFREELIRAVRQRDTKFVLSILDPQMTNSFGGDGGIEEFKRAWQPEQPKSPLWSLLEGLLSMGGCFRESRGEKYFCAPYVTGCFPEDLEVYEWWAVLRKGVPLYAGPSRRSRVIERLSYDIVQVPFQPIEGLPGAVRLQRGAWIRVRFGEREGFLKSTEVRSPIDWRVCFEKRWGRWVMTFLVSGD